MLQRFAHSTHALLPTQNTFWQPRGNWYHSFFHVGRL